MQNYPVGKELTRDYLIKHILNGGNYCSFFLALVESGIDSR